MEVSDLRGGLDAKERVEMGNTCGWEVNDEQR